MAVKAIADKVELNRTLLLELKRVRSSAMPESVTPTSRDLGNPLSNRQYPAPQSDRAISRLSLPLLGSSLISTFCSFLLVDRQLKDIHHDHLARFYGACLDPPMPCVLIEYCPKGSLQDILENDQFKLDSMFRYSLMHDIIKVNTGERNSIFALSDGDVWTLIQFSSAPGNVLPSRE